MPKEVSPLFRLREWIMRLWATLGGENAFLERAAMSEKMRDGDREAETASHVELVVALSVIHTVIARLKRAARGLLQSQDQLVAAAAEATRAEVTRAQFDSPARAAERADRAAEHRQRRRATLDRPVDLGRPLLAKRSLLPIEVALVIADVGFWYKALSSDINWAAPDALINVFFVVMLALVFPGAALWLARLGGGSIQRLLRHRVREHRVEQAAAVLVSLALMGALTVVLWHLVVWRYAPGGLVGTLRAPLPANAIAWMFVLTFAADLALRAFATSEMHEQHMERDAAVALDRQSSDVLDLEVVSANRQWKSSWLALAGLVDAQLSQVERAVAAGERIILLARAKQPPATVTLPSVYGSVGRLTRDGDVAADHAQVRWHLKVNLLQSELRQVHRALEVLAEHEAPGLSPSDQLAPVVSRVAEAEARLAVLSEDQSGGAGQAVDERPATPSEVDETGTGRNADHEVIPFRPSGTDD